MVRVRVKTTSRNVTRTYTGSAQSVLNRMKQDQRRAIQQAEQELRKLRNRL